MTETPWEVLGGPSYDLDDPEQLLKAQEAATIRGREEKELVAGLLRTYEGRAFMWMVMQTAGVDRSVFSGEEAHVTAYNCGLRDVGLWVQQWVFTAAPETYSMIRREAVQREKRYAQLAGHDTSNEEG